MRQVEEVKLDTVWATATATRSSDHRQIVYRFVKEFPPGFNRSSLPERAVLFWRYKSTDGMPSAAERALMDQMEDLLTSEIETSGLATLVMVSTGEDLREWTYYTKVESYFLSQLNRSLESHHHIPVEVHVTSDPNWKTYEAFMRAVKACAT